MIVLIDGAGMQNKITKSTLICREGVEVVYDEQRSISATEGISSSTLLYSRVGMSESLQGDSLGIIKSQ